MGRNICEMEKISYYSLAKVNLGLEVGTQRPDGYHEIVTLFQTIDLKDRLTFKSRSDGQIILRGNRKDIPWDKKNLIYKAALILQQATDTTKGAEIIVGKNIPPGRGLAGGSSNSAITLMALNRLWDLNLTPDRLLAIASELGADVPFFFFGGLCVGRGKGEQLKPLDDLLTGWLLVVIPDFPVSTAMAYQEYKRQVGGLTSKAKESKIYQFLENKNIKIFRQLRNDLELIVFKIHPQLAEIKKALVLAGAELSLMSGSGSAVFGWFRTLTLATKAAESLKTDYRVLRLQTVGRESYWHKISTGA